MSALTKNASRTRRLTACAVMAAVCCLLGPVSVPIGPVPISLGTLGIYMSVTLLGWRLGSLATLVYLLLGLVGLPVFTGFMGGAGRLFGPTGGYLMGYLPMALVSGAVIDAAARRFAGRGGKLAVLSAAVQILGMVLGTAVLYVFGTAWFCVQSGSALSHAIAVCVTPFIPFDIVKIAVAATVCGTIRRRLEQAELL